ncbi:DUF2851 family protein [Constantimarinum furrinae]|uniref:DUF2851 domain-containing protein n=1 Tax=Constantimarinum furrinae TaxID=2562285 RepID=A0A7G8PV84_9FLAO|nr:DUF2851 family protein [Constantimarinum furrinae]QNJ98250.1 hypothetical protein ALE3EI_1698 [Constantimarinum furrinae]
MREDFLHYVWKFQKFDARNLLTVQGETLTLIDPGSHNLNSGPDFFNGQILVNDLKWIGNIEIHLKSSDWYVHQHQTDKNYDNVILHVVWEHDAEVFRNDNTSIPTLELKKVTHDAILTNYHKLFSNKEAWIYCENNFATVPGLTVKNWLERLYFERLELRNEQILKELSQSKNHWEAVLFYMLSKSFGLKVNGESFYSIAKSVPFTVIKKCSKKQLDLEALLLGQAGMLNTWKEDMHFEVVLQKYNFIKQKFKIDDTAVIQPKFFRLRPPNFPTIRLSQLAALFSTKKNLFSEVIETKTAEGFYRLFAVHASSYWDTHYNFDVSSSKRKKSLSKGFIDLLIINTLIPIKFCYATYQSNDISEEIVRLASGLRKEENAIIKKFNQLRPVAENALESQALLQLKKCYCNPGQCLKCAIGNSILKQQNASRVN